MKQKKIIDPVGKEQLLHELLSARFIKQANRGNNLNIYTFDAKESPNLMREVARLREESFRLVGGGTGKSFDMDYFDTHFDQLIVWDSANNKIVGGYRIQLLSTLMDQYNIHKQKRSDISPLATYFSFSKKFVDKYLNYSAELGRSFVSVSYQKSPFALEALFDGLGAWIQQKNASASFLKKINRWRLPVTYLIGKITLYPNFGDLDPIYHFMDRYFESRNIIKPKGPYGVIRPYKELTDDIVFTGNFKADFTMIVKRFNAPVLVGQYGKLSPKMLCLGTILNKDFGATEETAILIKVPRIYPEYLKRYNIL
ncbi:TPA: hemolysin [Patescibacteria group bacterium]|nr:hemolysin [Candidatus Gracilibacteria bacterium]